MAAYARVTKIFERSRKSLQQRIHVYRASRSPCFAHCELDCSPSFTVVITLSMMLFFCFFLFCSVLFCFVSFLSFFFFAPVVFYSCFIFFGGGRGDFSSCASDESSSEHIKLASVTLASIVSISMSEIVSTVLLDTVGMLMMAKNASNL